MAFSGLYEEPQWSKEEVQWYMLSQNTLKDKSRKALKPVQAGCIFKIDYEESKFHSKEKEIVLQSCNKGKIKRVKWAPQLFYGLDEETKDFLLAVEDYHERLHLYKECQEFLLYAKRLKVGDKVYVQFPEQRHFRVSGTVKYIGAPDPKCSAKFFGVELQTKCGNTDGRWKNGKHYFYCEQERGAFVSVNNLVPPSLTGEKNMTVSRTEKDVAPKRNQAGDLGIKNAPRPQFVRVGDQVLVNIKMYKSPGLKWVLGKAVCVCPEYIGVEVDKEAGKPLIPWNGCHRGERLYSSPSEQTVFASCENVSLADLLVTQSSSSVYPTDFTSLSLEEDIHTKKTAQEEERQKDAEGVSSVLQTKIQQFLKSSNDKESLEINLKQAKEEYQKLKNECAKENKSLSQELHQTKKTLEESEREATRERGNMKEALEKLKSESSKEIKELEVQLEGSKQLVETLNLCKTQSARDIEVLREELKQTNISLEEVKTQSSVEKQTLEDQLKDSKQLVEALNQFKSQSAKEMEVLNGELKRTKKAEEESCREIQRLTDQLEDAKQLKEQLEQDKLHSAKDIEMLSEELTKTKSILQKTIKDLTRKMDSLKDQLEGVMKLKDQLQQEQLHSVSSIESLQRELEWTKQALEQTTQDRNTTRTELKQYQLEFAKELRAAKEAIVPQMEAVQTNTEDVLPSNDSRETKDKEFPVSAAEFGKLICGVSDHLTLDHTLQLSQLFHLPPSECDLLRRLSVHNVPGLKFLEIMQEREIINVYDVTNLQKAFTLLQLEKVNLELVKPYHDNVDVKLHNMHKAKEWMTWEDVLKACTASKEESERQEVTDTVATSIASEDKLACDDLEEKVAVEEEGKSPTSDRSPYVKYVERKIGECGGEIAACGACVSIPAGALSKDQVVAFSVYRDSDKVLLPDEVNSQRITPLLKLEPLGLKFKKPVHLIAPHSAVFSELEHPDVCIYSGMTTRKEGSILEGGMTWTKETKLTKYLKENSVEVEISKFSYLSVSLCGETSTRNFIKRAVLFVDSLSKLGDDIKITVCLCNNHVMDYKDLLLDYDSKLQVEEFSTVCVKQPSDCTGDAPVITATISSRNDTFLCEDGQDVHTFPVNSVCSGSRLSYQFTMKNNVKREGAMIDIQLTISQDSDDVVCMKLQTKVQNLLLSERSREMLATAAADKSDIELYNKMKDEVSHKVDHIQCEELASFFELAEVDRETVLGDVEPGVKLISLLEKKSLLNPSKLINLFEGLNRVQLPEAAQLVADYVDKHCMQKEEQKQPLSDISCGQSRRWPSFFMNRQVSREHLGYLVAESFRGLLPAHSGVWNVGQHPHTFNN